MSKFEISLPWDLPEPGDVKLLVTGNYTAGTPDEPPSMRCAGGYPGDPAEVEVLTICNERGTPVPEFIAERLLDDKKFLAAVGVEVSEWAKEAADNDRASEADYREQRERDFAAGMWV